MTESMWTAAQVAEFMQYTGPHANGTARKVMSRLGVAAVHRMGPSGRVQAYYPEEQVRAAAAARPGQGARGDLKHVSE